MGLYVYLNAAELLRRGSGPYLYLPKLEVENEARFWHRVASWMEAKLELPKYSIRFTVLVETLPALLRLEPIVWSLRKRLVGLNVGRWDYIFSCIKVLRHPGYVLPDRRELTMAQPQLAEYARWVVNVAHRRGCHAIGGMAANVPSRKDHVAARAALEAVEVDKLREVMAGHDGTWVAHPDLVQVAMEAFDSVLKGEVEQRRVVPGPDVLNVALVTSPIVGNVTDAGVREAAKSALVYLDAWLGGNGCVAMDGKMEDAATAEISRALLWGWLRNGIVGRDYVEAVIRGEAGALVAAGAEPRRETVELLLSAVFSPEPPEFITLPAYDVVSRPQPVKRM
jgi:malate synthase